MPSFRARFLLVESEARQARFTSLQRGEGVRPRPPCSSCRNLVAVIVLTVLGLSPAVAQENVEAGKTPAQLYASDCAICHKTPQGLAKAGGLFGLASFLREHYTASRETAAVLADYLKSVDRSVAPAARRHTAAHRSKGNEKPKADKAKAETGTSTTKSSTKKPASAKTTAGTASEEKAADSKAVESKPAAETPRAAEPPKPAKPD